MDIYAKKGTKVICENPTGGYPFERTAAKKHLEVGKEYTVEKTVVHNWHTEVYLQEFPGVSFNSIFFETKINK